MQELIVFSDYICPFCYVGKRRAETLGEEFPIRPVWKGFEIHPETPPEGIPISHFAPEMVSSLEANVTRLAEEIGLEMRMPERLSNSRLALIGGEFAREEDKLGEYHEAVFRAYFQDGKDIGGMGTLLEIAENAGMERESFKEALNDEKHMGLLKNSVREAHSLGLTGVPSYVFANRTILVGAQTYDVFKAYAQKSIEDVSSKG